MVCAKNNKRISFITINRANAALLYITVGDKSRRRKYQYNVDVYLTVYHQNSESPINQYVRGKSICAPFLVSLISGVVLADASAGGIGAAEREGRRQ
jgi:hypothetical protein